MRRRPAATKSNCKEIHPKSPRSGENPDRDAKGSSKRIHPGTKGRPSEADETANRRQATEHQPEAFVAKDHRVLIWQVLERTHSTGEKIDEAFGGQPFLPKLSPLDIANRQRFNAYFFLHKAVTNVLVRAIKLYVFADWLIEQKWIFQFEQKWVFSAIEDMNLKLERLDKRIKAVRLSF